MKKARAIALVSVGLVAGLVLGSVGIGYAVTEAESASPALCGGGRMGQGMREAGGRLADVVAGLTGLTVEEIRDKRQAGESIAEIAADEGVSAEDVVAEAIKIRTEFLDAKVAAGELDRARADAMLERMTERLTERVSSTETGRPGWAGGGRGGRGGGCGRCGSAGGS